MSRGSARRVAAPLAAARRYYAPLARRVVLDDELHVTRDGHLGALGATHQARLQLVELDLEVARNGGQHLGVTTGGGDLEGRSEEHTSELQSLMRISYAVFCLKQNKHDPKTIRPPQRVSHPPDYAS